MQHKSISKPKRLVGAVALLLLASASFGAYAAGDDATAAGPQTGATPAAAAATANMNAGQVNNQPIYTVTSPAPGAVAVTTGSQPAPQPPSGPPPQPPTQAAPYPPPAPPPGQH